MAAAVFVALSSLFSGDYYDARLAWLFAAMAAGAAVVPGRPATPDLPEPDLPVPDLPAPDLPAPDLPASDLPASDLPGRMPVRR